MLLQCWQKDRDHRHEPLAAHAIRRFPQCCERVFDRRAVAALALTRDLVFSPHDVLFNAGSARSPASPSSGTARQGCIPSRPALPANSAPPPPTEPRAARARLIVPAMSATQPIGGADPIVGGNFFSNIPERRQCAPPVPRNRWLLKYL